MEKSRYKCRHGDRLVNRKLDQYTWDRHNDRRLDSIGSIGEKRKTSRRTARFEILFWLAPGWLPPSFQLTCWRAQQWPFLERRTAPAGCFGGSFPGRNGAVPGLGRDGCCDEERMRCRLRCVLLRTSARERRLRTRALPRRRRFVLFPSEGIFDHETYRFIARASPSWLGRTHTRSRAVPSQLHPPISSGFVARQKRRLVMFRTA